MSQIAKEERQVSKTLKTLGGMAGGAVEACVLQPLDTVKTRLQLAPGKSSGAIQMGKQILQQEGGLALYKGLSPFVTHLVTKYALRFYTFEFYRSKLADEAGHVSKLGGFAAGLGAGVTEAILIVTPFEVIKTRLQQQRGLDKSLLKYQNPIHCVTTVLKEEGPAGLWKGLAPTMARQGLNQCFLFGTYDLLKQSLWGVTRNESLQPHQAVLTGMLAGVLGPCVNCPVDVCKTRLMAQDNKIGENPKYRGMVHCIRTIYQEEGLAALYKGLVPRVARVAPGQGITFMVMELCCNMFAE